MAENNGLQNLADMQLEETGPERSGTKKPAAGLPVLESCVLAWAG